MQIKMIPIDAGEFDRAYSITVAGGEYVLRLRYNQRLDRFFAELYEPDGVTLIRGSVKVLSDWAMWSGSSLDPRMPRAVFYPQTLNPDNSPPGLMELGEDLRVELLVVEPDADE